jgi:hypothetical protein
MLKKTILASLVAGLGASHAADISSVDCTPPFVIVDFDAAVNDYSTASASQGLTSIKLKKTTSASENVPLEPLSGTWDSDRDQFTIRPTRKNYEDTYSWNVWPVAVETTADGDTDTAACN